MNELQRLQEKRKKFESKKKEAIQDIKRNFESIEEGIGKIERMLESGKVSPIGEDLFKYEREKIAELSDEISDEEKSLEMEEEDLDAMGEAEFKKIYRKNSSSFSLKVAELLYELDHIADDLENYNPEIAHVVDRISDELETKVVSSIGGAVLRKIKDIVSKIPKMPSKDEAADILREFITKKGKREFIDLIEEITSSIKDSSVGGARQASAKETWEIIKGLASPKVLGAALVMLSTGVMGVNQLYDAVMGGEKQEVVEKTTDFKGKDDIVDKFLSDNPGKKSGVIDYAGEKYGIGIHFHDGKLSKSISKKRSLDEAMKALPQSVPVKTLTTSDGYLTLTRSL